MLGLLANAVSVRLSAEGRVPSSALSVSHSQFFLSLSATWLWDAGGREPLSGPAGVY